MNPACFFLNIIQSLTQFKSEFRTKLIKLNMEQNFDIKHI